MKRLFIAGSLAWFLIWQPSETGHSQVKQAPVSSKAAENDTLRKANAQTQQIILTVINQINTNPKVVYTKVYPKPPKKKLQKGVFAIAPEKLKALVTDSLIITHVVKPEIKKDRFFKRLIKRIFKKHQPPAIEKTLPEIVEEIIQAEDRLEK